MALSEDEELELLELEEAEYQAGRNQPLITSQQTGVDTQPQSEEKSTLEDILSTVDSYTGAPTRASIGAAQDGKNPFTAFADQFGEDPSSAPTGKQIVRKAGVPDTALSEVLPGLYSGSVYGSPFQKGGLLDLTASGTAGFAMDVAADPTSLIPVSAFANGGKALSKIPKVANLANEVGDTARGLRSLAGTKLAKFAEEAARNSTGATGFQASKFADNAGRELLDRRIVRFGDDQEKIAERATRAVEESNKLIDDSLGTLEKNGVDVDGNDVYQRIQNRITELKSDPSKADIVANLERDLENLILATDAKGSSHFGVKEAEQVKRGYNRKAGNWADQEKSQAGKEMYQIYRHAVEDAAQAADPATAALFKEGKATHGLLEPIAEAAERRAMTTAQSPIGGFLDMTSGIGGAAAAGPAGAILSPIARRLVSPRVASSTAVTADRVSKYLLKSPQMQQLAKRNPKAFEAMTINLTRRIVHDHQMSFPASAGGELDKDSSVPANYLDTAPPKTGTPTPERDPQGLKPKVEKSYDKNALLMKTQGTPFAQILQNAAGRGDFAVAATNFILQQTNPEYRKAVMESQDDGEGDKFSGGYTV